MKSNITGLCCHALVGKWNSCILANESRSCDVFRKVIEDFNTINCIACVRNEKQCPQSLRNCFTVNMLTAFPGDTVPRTIAEWIMKIFRGV